MQVVGRRWDTGETLCVEIDGDRISRSTPGAARGGESADRALQSGPWIAPGLIDVQVNGYGGQEFSSAELTPEKVGRIVRTFERFGVTRTYPTLTTESRAVLCHALRAIASACESSPVIARRVPGIHVEGPYITAEDGARGAHPQRHCRPPDWEEFQLFQEAAGGRIRILTLSPEYDNAVPFIERVVQSGVLVAIGHTAASPDQIRAAVDAGARMSTHLGNGAHLLLCHPHNYVWEQMAEDRLMAGIICDGHHLPPEVVKTIVRAKTPQRCIVVSDLSGQGGQPPGRYSSPFCDIEILDDGRLVVAGQRELMGGAAFPLNTGVANVMRFAGVDLACAIRMVVHQPAKLLGIPPGGLEPGEPANLIQFRLDEPPPHGGAPGFDVLCTIVDGELVWGQPWAARRK